MLNNLTCAKIMKIILYLLLNNGIQVINSKQKESFFPPLFHLMETNMERLFEDVSWLIEKFDYENKDADWKNSKDALQRGMQKLKGSYPADPVYKKR